MTAPAPRPSGSDPAPKPLSSGAAADCFESLSFSRQALKLLPPPPREIEIRYLVPPCLVSSIIDSLPPKEIAQHYFPPSTLKSLLQRFSVHADVADTEVFNSARVRRTKYPNGERSYEIEFKGSKEELNGLRISRAEFGRSISRKEFKELRDAANLGTVRKLRYDVGGSISLQQEIFPVNAQVDVFEMAGAPARKLDQQYVTVDIELSMESLVAPFCAGHHTFSFLSKCVDMSANAETIMRHLSSTQVACHGLGKKQLRALNHALMILAQRALEAQE